MDFCDLRFTLKRFEKKARIGKDPSGLCVQLAAAAASGVGKLAICLCGDGAVCIKDEGFEPLNLIYRRVSQNFFLYRVDAICAP